MSGVGVLGLNTAVVQGGYETTASALGFTIYNLAANHDKAAKLMKVRAGLDSRL